MFRIADILNEASKKRLAEIAKAVYTAEHRRKHGNRADKKPFQTEQRESVLVHR